MKSVIMLAALFTLCLSQTMAQKETKNFSVGFGLEAGAPTGAMSELYDFATGLTIRFSFHAGPGFITLTTGAIGYAPKTLVGVKGKAGLEIPVRAGYKYIIGHHFFVMGEAGYSEFKTYFGENGEIASVSNGSFVAAPSLGVQFNAFEIGVRYNIVFSNGGGGLFAARLGFNF
jgi:hypothetical protein